ncbi:hypothetical protein ERHA54_49440 (plasmid) [Erwinia rhapontici]|uniref:Secreted protein n=1 Tax=Erwinia rhapontici TaxID=55212 RepID=A0ABM7N784_ERWRD|nr:hypothetical protein [Erwinia rhapontici]BCQ37322.1 hypothetical protein ERHA53_46650 [Erwinia rhapontici]BCQ42341.1 hypothetical protein ERHA54_49440 [Erwinia rhapontici]
MFTLLLHKAIRRMCVSTCQYCARPSENVCARQAQPVCIPLIFVASLSHFLLIKQFRHVINKVWLTAADTDPSLAPLHGR